MPAVNVNIQIEIISWALSQTQEEKLGDKLMNHITQWLNGTKLFSLLHEVANIWIGEDDLAAWVGKQTGFEICNHVTPEIISKYQEVLQYVQSCGLYKEQALQAWAPGIENNPAKPEYILTEIGIGYRMRERDK